MTDVDPERLLRSAADLRARGFDDLADRLEAAAEKARELEADA